MTGDRPPRVWLGDAVRAVDRLAADAADAARITDLLGVRVGLRAAVVPSPAPAAVPRPAPVPPPEPQRREVPVTARNLVAAPATDTASSTPIVVSVRQAPPAAPRDLPPLTEVLSLDGPVTAAPVPADLLEPRHQRALLSAVASGLAPTDEIDVDAAVELLSRGEPLDPPPRRSRATTRRGLEVLVDYGDAMIPFARDQAAVLRIVARVAGPDGLRVLRFATTPLDEPGAGPGPLRRWRTYRPQPAGVPVLALTELGLLSSSARRAAVQARWVRFAVLLREAGCPFVALVPVPAARIPAALRRSIAVVVWDRPTRVRDAVVAVRRAGGRQL